LNKKVTSERRIGKEVEESGHGLILRYCPGIFLEGTTKITINLSEDNRSSGRDLNPGPPEYEAVLLAT
jgi:hypothetical protein